MEFIPEYNPVREFESKKRRELWLSHDELVPCYFKPVTFSLERVQPARETSNAARAEYAQNESTLVVSPPVIGLLSIEDIARMAVPAAAYIAETSPGIIFGCDRGGRLYSLATQATYKLLFEPRTPTIDGRVHFARLSKTLDIKVFSTLIHQHLHAANRQHQIERGSNPETPMNILFIDDWVHSGMTREMIKHALIELDLQEHYSPHFAVMCGSGAEATGSLAMDMAYFDGADPRYGGVDYNGARGYATRTTESQLLRVKLYDSVRKVAGEILKKQV